jgi:chromosome partitioning protein
MAKIFAVVSQKGGAGKSSIARALATAFAAAGWQTEIADMDIDQGTATSWQQRRLKAGVEPTITVRQFGNPAQALSKASACDMLIFDGAPMASKATAVMALAADLVIIPTGLALDDLEPAAALANALVDRDSVPVNRIVFALNQTGTSALEVDEARTYLSKTRFDVLDGAIPKKPAFSRAQDAGLSLIETPFKGPRQQAAQVISAAVTRFELLTA